MSDFALYLYNSEARLKAGEIFAVIAADIENKIIDKNAALDRTAEAIGVISDIDDTGFENDFYVTVADVLNNAFDVAGEDAVTSDAIIAHYEEWERSGGSYEVKDSGEDAVLLLNLRSLVEEAQGIAAALFERGISVGTGRERKIPFTFDFGSSESPDICIFTTEGDMFGNPYIYAAAKDGAFYRNCTPELLEDTDALNRMFPDLSGDDEFIDVLEKLFATTNAINEASNVLDQPNALAIVCTEGVDEGNPLTITVSWCGRNVVGIDSNEAPDSDPANGMEISIESEDGALMRF